MDEFERRMEPLRARFVERARADGGALREAWTNRDYLTVRQIAHSLAGNAGIFGHPELGRAALALEAALDLQSSCIEVEPRLEELSRQIADLPDD